jgi:methylglutaconyl-CoA hydratase
MPNQVPLIVERQGSVLTLSLNNHSKKNALNSEMMGAMTAAIEGSGKYKELRAVVIQGAGSVFCSGAEVTSWKAEELQLLLRSLVECSLPTISYVHGICLGGGMGLAGASDFVLAEEGTKFGFPEVKIGMVPAVISPYVARKLSLGKMRELFITGEIFGISQALSIGFLYGVGKRNENGTLQTLISDIEKGGPQAQTHIKRLLDGDILSRRIQERDLSLADFISQIREGSESKEGIRSFLEKRKPDWCRDD